MQRRELERILPKGFFMLDEIMDYECSSFLVQFDHAFQHTYQHISSVKDDTSAKRLVCSARDNELKYSAGTLSSSDNPSRMGQKGYT
ncbi:unnamed protein product [Sphagnum troendelagicum]|uniref:Uncharacterized protein n=1 Tax=Sphagnum troendelagicum TaxID=128251 RepID=A0ABP0T8W0_9BRYO